MPQQLLRNGQGKPCAGRVKSCFALPSLPFIPAGSGCGAGRGAFHVPPQSDHVRVVPQLVGNGHLEPGMQVLTKPFAMDALAVCVRAIVDAR